MPVRRAHPEAIDLETLTRVRESRKRGPRGPHPRRESGTAEGRRLTEPEKLDLPDPLDRPARALLQAIDRAEATKGRDAEELVAKLHEAVGFIYLAAHRLVTRPGEPPSGAALAMWSHRLREPLFVVVGWMLMLTKEPLDGATYARGYEAIARNLGMFVQRLRDMPS
jgi:hypothetical protein